MIRRITMSVIMFLISTTVIWGQEINPEPDTITAEGTGMIALNGNVDFIIQGQGLLFIVDRTDDARIEVASVRRLFYQQRQTRGNTVHIYRRFEGSATISGNDIALVMEGIDIHIAVSGTGMMLLIGDGNYSLNAVTQPWTVDGTLLPIGDRDR